MTGLELTHARNQLRLTQSELAELLMVNVRTIQRYERAPLVPQSLAWALLEIKNREEIENGIYEAHGFVK